MKFIKFNILNSWQT